ncbi:Ig-like domain-containing protein [Methanofollis sp. UBA420]|jgi:hypothetical protein|uniref:Ig-like domain-containing protein n=1 Tax=Methanofollis sp. UBA420 TaxID=1915514 RepID=UPI00316ACE1E
MQISYSWIMLLGVLMLCSASAAADTQISLNTDKDWLVAGSGGTSTVTVTATGATTVVLSCDPAMGTVTPSTLDFTAGGLKTATFTVGEKSGDATITGKTLNATGAVVAENTVVQKVDHAAPYKLALTDYRSEATVGSEVPIVLALVDYYGNRIDNRWESATGRDAESVTFSVGSPGDSAVFLVNGSVTGDTAVCPVDGDGNVTVTLRLGRKAGENIVFVNLPSPISDTYFTFYGLSDAPPASITCAVSPDGTPFPWVYADGKSTFTITCTLMDADGNPSVNRSVHVSTSLPGEEKTLRSNNDGLVMFTYGPKDKIGKVTITATSADNSSVTCSQTVEFTSTDPVDMILTASPQTMPSRDVKDDMTAEIRAKVVDVKGNPVKGQTVTFSLSNIDTEGYTATAPPELVETSAVTKYNESAIVHFRPGAFVQDRKNKTSATGTCKVIARWGDDVEDLTLTWKNYPYLSVSTAVDNETVTVNQTVNVTVCLRGDGYALQPDPINVILAIDRSGSMLEDDPDRMHSVREAAKKFVDRMTTKDKVGLVTFGRNTGSWYRINKPGESSFDNPDRYIDNAYHTPKRYLDYATVDLLLTDALPSVKTELDNIVPDSGTPMRAGLYKSIKELTDSGSSNPDPDAIKAIIVLSDGDYNWYGDPLARGDAGGYWGKKRVWDGEHWHYEDVWVSDDPEDFGDLTQKYYRFTDLSDEEQDLSVYAKNHNIKIYSIGYADTISADGKKTLKKLAESTGGKYYDGSAANIGAIYTAIAGELKTEAGVNTKMDISFKDVEVNNEIIDGDAVFTYLHIPGKSTYIDTWIDNTTPPYVPPHNPSYPYTEDQTTDWNDDHNLHFNIGTIHLNQTWTATYTLTVLRDGNINIFGQGSTISFDNGTETLDLPRTFITALPGLNNTGINASYLWVGEPSRVESGPITDFLRMKWNLNYTGNQTATQKLFYSIDGKKTWILFEKMDPEKRTHGLKQEVAVLDVRDRPAAQYWIRVRATAPDAPPAGNETSVSFFIGNATNAKIRLQ